MEPYYYSQMPKLWQSAYRAMKAGLNTVAPVILVPRLETEELEQILFQLRLDCPEIFYVTGFSCRVHPAASSVEFLPKYRFDKSKIREQSRAMEARTAKLVRPALGLSDWEKEVYVHDFICQNVNYDKLKKPYSHEILGPMGQGVGVCEGIAKTVKHLCNALGLWCIIAISENNPEKGIKYRHAWNVVRMDGTYYHLDATFDNTLGQEGLVRYDYFNLSDAQLFRDHEPVLFAIPSCGSDRFYYREKKLSFTKQEEVSRRAIQAIRRKKPLVFHWRGGYLTRETLNELLALLDRAAKEKDLCAQVRLNWPQAVLQANFVPNEQGGTFTRQEANEGEFTE